MILESIVTSVDGDGNLNVAPMGPTVQGNGVSESITQITLRPFRTSNTYRNLKPSDQENSGKAVVHVTDDSMLFARGAVGDILPDEAATLVTPLDHAGYYRLLDCHRWFAVQADRFIEDEQRATITCRIVDSGTVRPFFGFNRAKHAVIEAAILATRTHLMDAETINQEIQRLRPLVDKTCGLHEGEAFGFLVRTIEQRISKQRIALGQQQARRISGHE